MHGINSEPPRVCHEPVRNPPIDLIFNPVESICNKADTNWYKRQMYTMDQSCANLQTNSITCDSDMLQPGTKNPKMLSKILFFATFTSFRYKRKF